MQGMKYAAMACCILKHLHLSKQYLTFILPDYLMVSQAYYRQMAYCS